LASLLSLIGPDTGIRGGVYVPEGSVYGAALNVRSVLEALGPAVHEPPYKAPPQAPVLYIKPPNTFAASGGQTVVPKGMAALEANATLAIVIGRAATRVSEARALAHVRGYTAALDLMEPKGDFYRPGVRQRCGDGFLPIGPRLVAQGDFGNPDAATVRTLVNGVLRSNFSTAELVRPVARLIADISDFMTLEAGDALLVGFPMGGPHVGPGDTVAVAIDGLDRLEVTLVGDEA
jgi:5-oxopent-3-ene-1,2,5-tricarboxylate decarboxylase/2-hydroxyhepta-2,4-diene-1,7-dioate isomerase